MDPVRKENVYLAKVCEQAERFEDMVEAVKRFAQLDVELTPEERNLFAVAYKTVISQRRASWRLLLDLEEKEHGSKGASQKLAILQDVRNMLEKEMSQIAHEVLSLVEKHLLPNSTSEEALIFFQKMYGNDTENRGDYYRYCSETAMGQQRREAAQTALLAYKAAYDGAIMHLHPTHPLRLGLALNFSVFYYEILGANERACKLAKQAFDDAMAELQLLGEHPFQESTAILQLIRDNLTVWNAAPESGAVPTAAGGPVTPSAAAGATAWSSARPPVPAPRASGSGGSGGPGSGGAAGDGQRAAPRP